MTSQPKGLTPQLSVAPMLDWTDRHYRHFVRLIAPKCRLYSEMIVAEAILRGSPERLLSYSPVDGWPRRLGSAKTLATMKSIST